MGVPRIPLQESQLIRDAEIIAREFHEQYEWTAPMYGWKTQQASAVGWDELPENQRRLMVHVVGNLLASNHIVAGPRTARVRT